MKTAMIVEALETQAEQRELLHAVVRCIDARPIVQALVIEKIAGGAKGELFALEEILEEGLRDVRTQLRGKG